MSLVIAPFDPLAKYAGFNQFDCQHTLINRFVKSSLKQQVLEGLSVAYALLEKSDSGDVDRFVGFCTIANHSIPLSALANMQSKSLPKIIPCVRLIMLGIHRNDAKKGLGSQLMNHVFDVVKDSANRIGCYGLYLDADAGAISFYKKLGFELLEDEKTPHPSPMFIPLSAIP
jgi:ribosomal protein S18 acetylase RimI-like enzyme